MRFARAVRSTGASIAVLRHRRIDSPVDCGSPAPADRPPLGAIRDTMCCSDRTHRGEAGVRLPASPRIVTRYVHSRYAGSTIFTACSPRPARSRLERTPEATWFSNPSIPLQTIQCKTVNRSISTLWEIAFSRCARMRCTGSSISSSVRRYLLDICRHISISTAGM